MSVGKICTRVVASAAPSESVRAAAHRMAEYNVGTLAVLDDNRVPVGVITDRDIALRIVARGRDPESVMVSDAMTSPARTVGEDEAIEEALHRMRNSSVRRLVVVDGEGKAVGVLSVDDVLDLLAEEAAAVGSLLRREVPVR